jgi:hypothetical protein
MARIMDLMLLTFAAVLMMSVAGAYILRDD